MILLESPVCFNVDHWMSKLDISLPNLSTSIPFLEDWVGEVQSSVTCSQDKCVYVKCVLCAHCHCLFSHPLLSVGLYFTVLQICGVTPRIKCIAWTFHCIGGSKLFNSLNRSSSNSAWCSRCSRSWRGRIKKKWFPLTMFMKLKENTLKIIKLLFWRGEQTVICGFLPSSGDIRK